QEALRIRIGISSGEAILGNIGCYGKMDYTAVGPPVILASRLEEHATPNTVLVSESTYGLLGGHFHLVPVPTFVPKGFTEAQRVWQVLGNRPLLRYSVEFVAPEVMVRPSPSIIAIQAGHRFPASTAEPLARHFCGAETWEASAAAQVYANPDWVLQHAERAGNKRLTLVMPQRPDFDTIVAAYLVQELLETGSLPRGTKMLVEYVKWVVTDTLPPSAAWWNTPYGVVLGIWGRNAQYCQEHQLPERQQDLYSVQRVFYFLQYLLGRIAAGVDILRPDEATKPALFTDTSPFQPPFERERAFVKRDCEAYNHDLAYASTFEVAYVGNRGRNLFALYQRNQTPFGVDGTVAANRPFPQWQGIQTGASRARSWYNALQAK
ncbi:adenylate/guanylate cyclase domain-containing protein, partial [Candidatus Parcubacteria bacterium]